MPEDVVVFYWVYNTHGEQKGGSNSWKGSKASADAIGGYVVAEGQSGEKKIVYHAKVERAESGQV
jgi:hypothetical protein